MARRLFRAVRTRRNIKRFARRTKKAAYRLGAGAILRGISAPMASFYQPDPVIVPSPSTIEEIATPIPQPTPREEPGFLRRNWKKIAGIAAGLAAGAAGGVLLRNRLRNGYKNSFAYENSNSTPAGNALLDP